MVALRAADERAFMAVVESWHGTMLRLAEAYVPSRAVAEEVVQETWLAVLEGVDRFQARSAVKTWVFRILVNRAKTRGERERRTVPFSSLAAREAAEDEPSVDPDRFHPAGHRIAGHWSIPPRPLPEDKLHEHEMLVALRGAIDRLPHAQRVVISLRDVEGWDAGEVCQLLDISDANQRVLLHRARSRVRAAVEVVAG